MHFGAHGLMGEAIALSLAAAISARLQMEMVNFFTDNLVLERFLNGDDLESPPDWRIKPYTQRFINYGNNRSIRIVKIDRSLNATAHSLASQAFRQSECLSDTFSVICNNPAHVSGCPLSEAMREIGRAHV